MRSLRGVLAAAIVAAAVFIPTAAAHAADVTVTADAGCIFSPDPVTLDESDSLVIDNSSCTSTQDIYRDAGCTSLLVAVPAGGVSLPVPATTIASAGTTNDTWTMIGGQCTGPDLQVTVAATTTAVMGNGIVEPGEQCDDFNTQAGDGCSPVGTIESGYSCTGSPSVCQQTGSGGTLGVTVAQSNNCVVLSGITATLDDALVFQVDPGCSGFALFAGPTCVGTPVFSAASGPFTPIPVSSITGGTTGTFTLAQALNPTSCYGQGVSLVVGPGDPLLPEVPMALLAPAAIAGTLAAGWFLTRRRAVAAA